ncbi:midcut-by-XrtH protein [Haliea sp. E17]|uniref:midcut-by-XrtH protein n=1 Tax=Haliea sp. E17 TaxID=3401576 RepID=UPI003AAF24FE
MRRSFILVVLCALAGTVLAQSTGTLTYGPAVAAAPVPGAPAATAVPIPLLLLLPLGIALAWLGFRALRKHSARLLGAVLILSGLGMGIAGSLQIPGAIALAVDMIELNDPNGGTVDIPQGNAVYTNTSTVSLKIGSVVAPPTCATASPTDECVPGLVLADTESCSTVYSCGPVCGNALVETGEACDDGNLNNNDACLNSCQAAACGDGIVWAAVEQCDDGNLQDGDGCANDCTIEPAPVCGNGIEEVGECGTFGTCQADCSSCTPSCNGLSCGDDGCGGSCGTCGGGTECSGGLCLAPPP